MTDNIHRGHLRWVQSMASRKRRLLSQRRRRIGCGGRRRRQHAVHAGRGGRGVSVFRLEVVGIGQRG